MSDEDWEKVKRQDPSFGLNKLWRLMFRACALLVVIVWSINPVEIAEERRGLGFYAGKNGVVLE